MIDFLRDPIWQFVGALFAFVAIVIAICFFVLQRSKKSISYRVYTETALLTVDEQIRGKLQIIFEGTPIQDVHLLVLQVVNNGNIPIVSSDFERPLSFAFGEDARILSVEVTSVTPKTLNPTLNLDSNRVVVQPLLLNSKDSITIKLLLAQFNGKIRTDARIVGVEEVKRAEETGRRPSTFLLLLNLLLVYLFLLLFWFSPNTFDNIPLYMWPLLLSVFIALLVYVPDILRRDFKRQEEAN